MNISILIIILLTGVILYLLFFKNLNNDTTKDLEDGLNNVYKNIEKDLSRIEHLFKDEMSRSRMENNTLQKDSREELKKNLDNNIDRLNDTVEKKLVSLQKDNSEKLEKMRETVDEKLHATLEKRFSESFRIISERLEMVHKGLGEMQSVAVGVNDLKKVLSNVKNRGTWGEVQLGSLLSEMLTTDQYETNFITKRGTQNRVEYAIRFPNNDSEHESLFLPIDAKFPLTDYEHYIKASEDGDIEAMNTYSKALAETVKKEAKDISEKYIDIPQTTEFGILYVPVESLYAEILRIPGLFDTIRRQYKVLVTGPTTIQALLNSFQMGFKTLVIQKRSSEIFSHLTTLQKEFGTFGDLLEKTHKKIQEAGNTIETAMSKSRTIEKKLNKLSKTEVLELDITDVE